MSEPFETFEHAGQTCELHQDYEPMSPADWDTLGELRGFDSARWGVSLESPHSGAEEANDRCILTRYLSLCHGVVAVPFYFADYGSSGARIYESTDPNGYIFTTHDRVTQLCGEDPAYHARDWIENALRGELETWDAYFQGDVCGYVVRDSAGAVVDSCWGFYPDDEGDGLEYVRGEARAAAEHEAAERERAARQDIATRERASC